MPEGETGFHSQAPGRSKLPHALLQVLTGAASQAYGETVSECGRVAPLTSTQQRPTHRRHHEQRNGPRRDRVSSEVCISGAREHLGPLLRPLHSHFPDKPNTLGYLVSLNNTEPQTERRGKIYNKEQETVNEEREKLLQADTT